MWQIAAYIVCLFEMVGVFHKIYKIYGILFCQKSIELIK